MFYFFFIILYFFFKQCSVIIFIFMIISKTKQSSSSSSTKCFYHIANIVGNNSMNLGQRNVPLLNHFDSYFSNVFSIVRVRHVFHHLSSLVIFIKPGEKVHSDRQVGCSFVQFVLHLFNILANFFIHFQNKFINFFIQRCSPGKPYLESKAPINDLRSSFFTTLIAMLFDATYIANLCIIF